MTNQFINQPAEDWAKRNLVRTIEIKPLHNSLLSRILVGLMIGFVLLIFLGIPAVLFYGSAVRYTKEGWSNEVSRAFNFGSFFLLAFSALTAFILFYLWNIRRNLVKFLTPEGVFTRGGKKCDWKNLKYLDFRKVETLVRGNIFLQLMMRAMYADVQEIKVEMFFMGETVAAVIPPLIANQREILELLNAMPVERRIDGRQNR